MAKVGVNFQEAPKAPPAPVANAEKKGKVGTNFAAPTPPVPTKANGPLKIQPSIKTMRAAVAAQPKAPPIVGPAGQATITSVTEAVTKAGFKVTEGADILQRPDGFMRRIRGVYPASLPIGLCKYCLEGPTKPETADRDRRLHLVHADAMTEIVPAWEDPVKGPSPGLGLCLGYQLTRELQVYLDPQPEKLIMRTYNVKSGNLLVLPATAGHMLASGAVRDYTASEGPIRWAELMAAHPLMKDRYVGSIGLHYRPILVVSAITGMGITMDKTVAPATVIKTSLMLSPSVSRTLNDFKAAYGPGQA